jgi:hypothetical protein
MLSSFRSLFEPWQTPPDVRFWPICASKAGALGSENAMLVSLKTETNGASAKTRIVAGVVGLLSDSLLLGADRYTVRMC